MDQRRHFSRVLFDTRATLSWEGASSSCTIRDLSLRGALVDLPDTLALRPEQACRLELVLDNDNGERIVLEGRIAHVQNQRLGLRATRIDLDSITHLRRLIELNQGDATDLLRELSALTPE